MAFVLQDTWHDEGRREQRAPAPGPLAALFAGSTARLRNGAGTIFTLLVHLGLLWVFATRLAGSPGEVEAKPPPGAGIVSLTLAPPAPAAPPAARVAAVTLAPQPEIDTSIATELPPPEWTVSVLKSAQAGAAAGPALASAQSSGSGGGGGVYDPFAGAAPLRPAVALVRDVNAGGLVPVGDESGLRLDERMLESLRLSLAQANPGLRGTVDLAMRISVSGLVVQAAPTGGSLPNALRAKVAAALLGKHLFLGTAANPVDLKLRVAI